MSKCFAWRTGSRHDPATGTHMRPLSATAIGGIILSCIGDPIPPHAVEKKEMPSRLRIPASCPNVEQPISKPSAWIMHDSVLATSRPTWRNRGLPSTRKVPDRAGRQVLVAPARFSGQSTGILASMHGGICSQRGTTRQINMPQFTKSCIRECGQLGQLVDRGYPKLVDRATKMTRASPQATSRQIGEAGPTTQSHIATKRNTPTR